MENERVPGKPDERQRRIIAAIVAVAMNKHNVAERRAGALTWEVNLSRGVRARLSYHGGENCAHRATLAVFQRNKFVFRAERSQHLFPERGHPRGRIDIVDVDMPGEWEDLLPMKAKA
jgi:hypothetical protein